MNAKKATAKNTAEQAFNSVRASIMMRIGDLQAALAEQGKAGGKHWGHVGSLNHIDSELRKLVEFLGKATA
jgi:hypothetical protein